MQGLLFFLLFSLLLEKGNGFSEGPPDGRCADGYPHHRSPNGRSFSQDIATSPYEITVDSGSSYSLGQNITVTIKNKDSNPGEMFTGFLIRAIRTEGDTDELLGTFSDFDEATTKPISYGSGSPSGQAPNCLSHNSNANKTEITVSWTAPNENVGDIVIGGTVVSNMATFYVGVEAILTPEEGTPGDVNLGPVYKPVQDYSHFDFTGCGSDYGCLKSPGNCSIDDCSFIVSWKPDPNNGDNIYYELCSEGAQRYDLGFVTLGWSEDKTTGDDDTVACVFDDQEGNIHYGVNFGHRKSNDRRRTAGFSELHLKREDGKLYCSFSRPAEISTYYWDANLQMQPVTINLKTVEYYLQVAHGPAYSFDSPSKHDVPPQTSDKKWNFYTSKTFQAFTGEEIINFSSGSSRISAFVAVVLAAIIVTL